MRHVAVVRTALEAHSHCSGSDLVYLPVQQGVQDVQNATNWRPQASQSIRMRADGHNAKAKPAQILLEMKTLIHHQQGIESLVGQKRSGGP